MALWSTRAGRPYPVDLIAAPRRRAAGLSASYFSKLNSSAAAAFEAGEGEADCVCTTVGDPDDSWSLALATVGVVAGDSAPARAIPEVSS